MYNVILLPAGFSVRLSAILLCGRHRNVCNLKHFLFVFTSAPEGTQRKGAYNRYIWGLTRFTSTRYEHTDLASIKVVFFRLKPCNIRGYV